MDDPVPTNKELIKKITQLENRCDELLAMLTVAASEVRALQEMSILFWQLQSRKDDDFPAILEKSRDEWIDRFLSTYADKNMISASQLKKRIDSFLK
jgi:hypothetical protein